MHIDAEHARIENEIVSRHEKMQEERALNRQKFEQLQEQIKQEMVVVQITYPIEYSVSAGKPTVHTAEFSSQKLIDDITQKIVTDTL